MSLRLILCCVVDKEESQRRQNKTEETAASGTYSAGDDMPYEVIPFCFVQLNSHPVVLFTVCQLTADSLTSLLYHFQLPKLVVSTLAAYSENGRHISKFVVLYVETLLANNRAQLISSLRG